MYGIFTYMLPKVLAKSSYEYINPMDPIWVIFLIIYIWATVKISEDQFSREGLKMTSDMHETL